MQKGFELWACSLPEITRKLREILNVFAGHAELNTAAVLDLSPFKQGIDVNDSLAVVVNEYLQRGIFRVVAANNALPCLDISVMKEFV